MLVVHKLIYPLKQYVQLLHPDINAQMTLSPGSKFVTPGPTDSTIPEPSCPNTTGIGMGKSPII